MTMNRLLALLIFVLISTTALAGPDSVYAVVRGDTVTIWNTDVEYYCGGQFQFDVNVVNHTIDILEDDTSLTHARCVCEYDLSASLRGLSGGNYDVQVYRHYYTEFPFDTMFVVGGTSFVVGTSAGPLTQEFFQSPCKVTPDVDVFPLSVGNRWTYRYFTQVVQNFYEFIVTTDSGLATYSIVSVIPASDSIRWFLRERRNLMHRYEIGPWDTTYSIQDSSTFELREILSGRHQLFVPGDPSQPHAFYFTRDFTDTTTIVRYRDVRANGTITFQSARPGTLFPPYSHSLFTFGRGVGMMEVDYFGGPLDFSESIHHDLLSSTITSAGSAPTRETPTGFCLSQNYPNPFNPTTTIQFTIPQGTNIVATLRVYDVLGREVATLVNEVKQPGTYTVWWDATGLSSGVYFCRLSTVGFVQIRKLLLLR